MNTVAQPVFACLGLNHRTASVALREQVAVPQRKLADTVRELQSTSGVTEGVLLSTCNRTEFYFISVDPRLTKKAVFAHFLGKEAAVPTEAFYLHRDVVALRHLAMVAAGLDSMVIGETEVFGQLKDAYRAACDAGVVGHTMHRVFQSVFSIAKRVRSSTQITSGPTSVGAAAVVLARDMLGDLAGAKVLVVGAGDVARSTAQSLRSRGAQSIFVANRSYERARVLAESVGGRVIRFAEWVPFLQQADIVIISTAAPVYVVTHQVVQQACASRGGRPLFLIDLSVPRNADPLCGEVDGAVLCDMDALQAMTRETMQQRYAEVRFGAQIIHDWLVDTGVHLLPPPAYGLSGSHTLTAFPAHELTKKTGFF